MTTTLSALLLLDLQNDFLAPDGVSPRRHVDAGQLSQIIRWLADAARQQGRRVLWICSVYGELGAIPEAERRHTHTGTPCCTRGSRGAQLFDPLVRAVDERDERVEKRWYSAFRDTALHERLRAHGVTRVVLAGVGTNGSVLATAREARALGYEVEVVSDATVASTSSQHTQGLREIEAAGGKARRWGELLNDGAGTVRLGGLGDGGTSLLCGALRDAVDPTTAFATLEREITWSKMLHRGGEVPRLVAIQGDLEDDGTQPLYRHPADGQPTMQRWTPAVDAIRRSVEGLVGHPLDHGLLQLYRDGRDWIGEHADKTLDLVRPSFIVNVSFGALRTMLLRPKHGDESTEAPTTQKIPLPSGSCLLMDLGTNRAYYHAIKQQQGTSEPRISLTFRHIGTRWHPATGAVWGTGAPTTDRAEATRRAALRAALDPDARRQALRDEGNRLLRIFREENIDPAFDPRAYSEGFELLDFVASQDPA